MSWSGHHLSDSTDGLGIKIVAVATAGTSIHDTAAPATTVDYIDLWAYNSNTIGETLVLEVGGTTDPDNLIVRLIPPLSWMPLVGNLQLSGSGSATNIAGFSTTANKVIIYGAVRRWTA